MLGLLLTIIFYFYLGLVSLAFLGLLGLKIYNLRNRRVEEYKEYRGRVLVIVPCKGIDLTLEQNLNSINQQDYKNYKLVAVVDNKDDAALGMIRKLGIGYITSESVRSSGSGKVRAIAAALEKMRGFDAYVIADSDITVSPDWLGLLLKPLSDKRIGVATAFPYFNPLGGFWSYVKMAWGFVGNGLMESEKTRFGWGGSLAFRKDLLDAKSLKAFKNAISDDIAITNAAKRKGLLVGYSADARPFVNVDESFGTFWEWSNRQAAFMMLGNRKLLKVGIVYYAVNLFLLISALPLAAFYSGWCVIFLLPFLIGLFDTYTRSEKKDVMVAAAYVTVLFVYLLNLINAGRMKKVTWRGREYELRL